MQKVWRDANYFIAFGFGLGTARVAPGTFGTLFGIALFIPMSGLSLTSYLMLTAVLTLFGIGLCQYVSDDLGVHDHSGIVWDEVCGYLLTMTAIPCGVLSVIYGFLWFRLFDILKPWPISWVDKHVKGGLGIMLDDIVAAIPAWLCTLGTYYFVGA